MSANCCLDLTIKSLNCWKLTWHMFSFMEAGPPRSPMIFLVGKSESSHSDKSSFMEQKLLSRLDGSPWGDKAGLCCCIATILTITVRKKSQADQPLTLLRPFWCPRLYRRPVEDRRHRLVPSPPVRVLAKTALEQKVQECWSEPKVWVYRGQRSSPVWTLMLEAAYSLILGVVLSSLCGRKPYLKQ